MARGKALAAVLPRAGNGKFLPLASRMGGPNVFQKAAGEVFYDAIDPSKGPLSAAPVYNRKVRSSPSSYVPPPYVPRMLIDL